jgi:hypothetical protein
LSPLVVPKNGLSVGIVPSVLMRMTLPHRLPRSWPLPDWWSPNEEYNFPSLPTCRPPPWWNVLSRNGTTKSTVGWPPVETSGFAVDAVRRPITLFCGEARV